MRAVSNPLSFNSSAAASSAPRQLLVFRLGDLRLRIGVQSVTEVTRALNVSLPFPDSDVLLGLTVLRGESTPVIDLGRLLGASEVCTEKTQRLIAMRHNAQTCCLLVSAIDGLLDVENDSVKAADELGVGSNTNWLQGVLRAAHGELVGMLNPDCVFSALAALREKSGKACV